MEADDLVSVLGETRGSFFSRCMVAEKLLGSNQDYTNVLSDAFIASSHRLSNQGMDMVYRFDGRFAKL